MTTKPTKAVFAGLTATIGGLITALADNGITAVEALTVALAAIVAVGGVYGITNTPKA